MSWETPFAIILWGLITLVVIFLTACVIDFISFCREENRIIKERKKHHA